MKLYILIFFLGLFLLYRGKLLMNKLEEKRDRKKDNSGVFLQIDFLIFYSGFILVVTSILFILFS